MVSDLYEFYELKISYQFDLIQWEGGSILFGQKFLKVFDDFSPNDWMTAVWPELELVPSIARL